MFSITIGTIFNRKWHKACLNIRKNAKILCWCYMYTLICEPCILTTCKNILIGAKVLCTSAWMSHVTHLPVVIYSGILYFKHSWYIETLTKQKSLYFLLCNIGLVSMDIPVSFCLIKFIYQVYLLPVHIYTNFLSLQSYIACTLNCLFLYSRHQFV